MFADDLEELAIGAEALDVVALVVHDVRPQAAAPLLTAGAAWADVDYTSGFGRHSDTHFGWVFGGGIERALTPNLSARVEYLYYDFD